MSQDPIIFEDDIDINVDEAPAIDSEHTAMGVIARRSAKRTGWLGRLFITSFSLLIGMVIALAFWDFVGSLLERNALLGQIALGLMIILGAVILIYVLRELWTIMRLNQADRLRQDLHDARNSGELKTAQHHCRALSRLYRNNPLVDEASWQDKHGDILDGRELIDYTEQQLFRELDENARAEIERRARQVAVVTAFVPLALVDLLTVLSANVGMIRAIADIYGARPGVLGGWRLFRRVATHLVATGAVAVGDDVIGSVLGGNVLGKLSRRFGEGVINAALTARVGVAAIEVCRPMEFVALKEPKVSGMISNSLAGFIKTRKPSENPST